ncbi:MAG: helix-turn-helix transcriptional regulator [Oscillospiraceae bacterium]|nr:helix-turn-helix transcriptional regulator [Oscillospiraceae bacterium]
MDQIKTGKFIASLRKEQGFTQAELAEKLGITDRAVSKWETGKCLPDAAIMVELCEILGISVNELLTGEKIAMDNYKEIAEKNLAESIRLENEKNQKLTKTENFIGWSGVVVSLIMIMCGIFVAEVSPIVAMILISAGGAIVLITTIYATLLECDNGYYECQNCKHRYVPTRKAVILAVHVGSDRVMKCPECGQKGWHKKVMTK